MSFDDICCPKCGVHLDKHEPNDCLCEWVYSLSPENIREFGLPALFTKVKFREQVTISDSSFVLLEHLVNDCDVTLGVEWSLDSCSVHGWWYQGPDESQLFAMGFAKNFPLAVCRFFIRVVGPWPIKAGATQ